MHRYDTLTRKPFRDGARSEQVCAGDYENQRLSKFDALKESLEESPQIATIDESTEFGETEELDQSDDVVAGIPQHAEETDAAIDVESVDDNDDDDTVPDVAVVFAAAAEVADIVEESD